MLPWVASVDPSPTVYFTVAVSMADDEVPNSGVDNADDQNGEARNDVVVKIGLVGDAQVGFMLAVLHLSVLFYAYHAQTIFRLGKQR